MFPTFGNLLTNIEEQAAKEPEMTVLTTAMLMAAPSPGLVIESWEPPLNARKPKNRMKPPRAAI